MSPQPSAPQPVPEVGTAEIGPLIARNLHLEGPLLPILHDMQSAFGFIPDAAVPMLAEALNLGRAEVHGVISFYHDFRKAPAGRHVLKICRAEACQAMGGEAMAERLLEKLGLDWHGTSADGQITVEPVYCLGLCACGPAAMLDDTLMGRASDTRLMAALEGAEA